MPAIVRGNNSIASRYVTKDMGYNYPAGLDLRPGSEVHERIVNNIMDRARDSFDVMSRRHPTWRKIDQTLTAYITLDEAEEAVQEADSRKPVSIVVPYSYATLETLLTYWVATFLNSPYFKYKGVTSEDTIGAIMLEKVVELQCVRNKVGLGLHTMFRDSLVYGFGVGSPVWTEKYGWKSVATGMGRVRQPAMLFEGNRLENIDPYLYLPDPSVPIHDVQRGEFVGWIECTNYMGMLSAETDNGDYFNARYLKGANCISSLLNSTSISDREKRYGGDGRGETQYGTVNPVDVVWMYITLVPNDEDWKLGSSDRPEKWLFGVAADEVVVCAKPLGLDHDMFPVAICVPDYDGYSMAPISRMEVVYGLQGVLDFLFDSHVANVRKAINDMLIVDPFLLNMSDFNKPGPGKLIRLRRAAWGRGVDKVAQQLTVNDVTRAHMTDAGSVIDIMQRVSSAVDNLMGVMRHTSERRSATESRDARMSALSRLAKSTKIASMMMMQDMGYMMASQTQQLMTQEVYVSTMGRFQNELEEEYGFSGDMKVTPDQLLIDYDCMVHDGTIDTGEWAEQWTQLFQIMATAPAIGAGFDMVRVFKHIARLMGAKNVNDFVMKGGGVKINMMQDALVQAEAAKGNMVSVEEAASGTSK